jgi:hypothetical protein
MEKKMTQSFYEVRASRNMYAVACGERILGLYEEYNVAMAVCDALNNEEARRVDSQAATC